MSTSEGASASEPKETSTRFQKGDYAAGQVTLSFSSPVLSELSTLGDALRSIEARGGNVALPDTEVDQGDFDRLISQLIHEAARAFAASLDSGADVPGLTTDISLLKAGVDAGADPGLRAWDLLRPSIEARLKPFVERSSPRIEEQEALSGSQ